MISVTQLLEHFPEKELIDWKLRVGAAKAQAISEQALRIGNVVDNHIQHDLLHRPREISPLLPQEEQEAVASCLMGWAQFQEKSPLYLMALARVQEELRREEILGHPDWILIDPALRGVIDIKTSSAIRPIHWTQVAAYSWLLNPEANVDFLGILRLDKTRATYEYQELTNPDQIDYEVQIWLYYKALYEHLERVKRRMVTQKEQETLHVP